MPNTGSPGSKSPFTFILAALVYTFSQAAWADSDPCVDAFGPSSSPSLTHGSSLSTRLQTLCELRDAIVNEYSLFDLKAERIKNPDGSAFDSLAHLNQCVAAEKTIVMDDSDLHFIDRVSQCIAGFQDTHFSIQAPLVIPPVYTGFFVKNVGGKYYISQVMPDIIKYVALISADPGIASNLVSAIQVGNQVIRVDGQDPAKLSASYASYISGSSSDFISDQADQAIFYRNFAYPSQAATEVVIKDSEGNTYDLQIPWWAGKDAHTRPDAMTYFKQLGIPVSDRLKVALSYQTGKPDWRTASIAATGYDPTQALFKDPYNRLAEYSDDSGAPGLRLGEIVPPAGDSFCYLQLLTFETTNFTPATTPPGKAAPFGDTIESFVADCNAKHRNLVLDLRSNPGGNGSLPDVLLSILTEPNKIYPADVLDFRITADTQKLLTAIDYMPDLAIKDLGDIGNNPMDIFDAALRSGQKESDIIPNDAAAAVGNGYSGKVLALVTPECISACDMMASLLSKSKRATLLGTHSDGTGAGFYSIGGIDSSFKDLNDEITTRIPNFMFGVPDQLLDKTRVVPYAQFKDAYLLENHPTIADIQYSLTLDDLNPSHPAAGWEVAVLTALAKFGAWQ